MSNTTDWLSAISALVGAAGGAFAARAAFLSARSAREAQLAADGAERRASLRDVAVLASSVLVEEQRVSNLTSQLKIGYQTMGLFSGSAGNSGIAECVAAVEQKLLELRTLAADARLFSEDAKSLSQSSMEDIDRVHTSQAGALKRAQALREELEREQSSVEARNAESRDSRDRTRPIWAQTRQMAETDRDAFLARFAPGGSGVGFAVLGGSFAEGIDLPGDRLVGAFVATLGLPQVNPVNEQRRIRLQHSFGAGFDYAYLYPGVQKVVQAAGRVIRGPDDRGVLFLINDRFGRPEVRRLLPDWWRPG